MKLKILSKKITSGFAKGKDIKNNDEYLVFGGDFFYDEIIEVEQDLLNNRYIIPQLNYTSTDIFEKEFDKDGLIAFNKLLEVKTKSKPFKRVYELNGYWVFPQRIISNHLEYLYENGIETKSKISISKSYHSTLSRVPVITINYEKILRDVLKNRKAISSWFYCEKEKSFENGVYADLYILGNINGSNIQIQLWQIVGKGEELQYAHVMLEKDTKVISHFDLATHIVNPSDIKKLIDEKKRLDLLGKKKWIRIDNSISEVQVFDLIKLFFPIDYLIDEFIERKC